MFGAAAGGRCGVQIRSFGDGTGELVLFHDGRASAETLAQLRAYVRAHLERRALPNSIEERPSFVCLNCRTAVSDAVVRKRRERGHEWLDCPVCGERVHLTEAAGLSSAVAADTVAAIDENALARRERAQAAQVVAGKRKLGEYDVFLCHNGADKPAVRTLARRLMDRGVLPWLDERDLVPGRSWQDEIQAQIGKVKSAAVLIGGSGVGPWQDKEVKGILITFIKRDRPVIPVVLPDAPAAPELPLFLKDYHWVDLRQADPDPLDQLEWGITGKRPGDD
jgi:hypothetical protein